jgi:hypothetical protein
MALSNKSFQEIAKALTPDVVKFIEKDERYVVFMQDVIPDAIHSFLGNIDENLKTELSCAIMDRLCFRVSNF